MPDPVLSVKVLRGREIAAAVDELARLRMTVFHAWPYLYAGDLAFEREYLSLYVNSPTAIAVLAYADGVPVGGSTALCLAEEPESVKGALAAAGIAPETVLYSAESVLLAPWRGHGFGVRFFVEREAHARALGLRHVSFCRIVRDPADPRRPAGTVELDAYWRRRGYTLHPEIRATLAWKEIGEPAESPKVMEFWLKTLA